MKVILTCFLVFAIIINNIIANSDDNDTYDLCKLQAKLDDLWPRMNPSGADVGKQTIAYAMGKTVVSDGGVIFSINDLFTNYDVDKQFVKIYDALVESNPKAKSDFDKAVSALTGLNFCETNSILIKIYESLSDEDKDRVAQLAPFFKQNFDLALNNYFGQLAYNTEDFYQRFLKTNNDCCNYRRLANLFKIATPIEYCDNCFDEKINKIAHKVRTSFKDRTEAIKKRIQERAEKEEEEEEEEDNSVKDRDL
jgi:hypothetical protein